MAPRPYDFSDETKKAAIERQGGVCAWCGEEISTDWSDGPYDGVAHHLKPGIHGGRNDLDNCVYVCRAHHMHPCHGMAPYGIDPQGGSSDTWVRLSRSDFQYWKKS